MDRRAGLAVLLAVLVAGSGCAEDRQPSPTGARPASSPADPVVPRQDTARRVASVRVEPGLRPYLTVFRDAEHGYVLLSDCVHRDFSVGRRLPARVCRGALLATADGGVSWSRRTLPVAGSADWLLTTPGPGNQLLLHAGGRYYESVDGGGTFKETRGPGREDGSDGRGGLGQRVPTNASAHCQWQIDSCVKHVVHTLDRTTGAVVRRSEPVELPPSVGFRPQAVALAGRLVLTTWTQEQGPLGEVPLKLYSAVSADEGRTWAWLDTPQAGRRMTLHGSRDGADAWLVPAPDPAVFPEVWRLGDDRWAAARVAGRPTVPGRYYAAAVGGGALAVAGPGGFGYVSADGRWQGDPRLPAGLDRVDLLADGVLALTRRASPERLYLGVGAADQRNWTEIVVQPG